MKTVSNENGTPHFQSVFIWKRKNGTRRTVFNSFRVNGVSYPGQNENGIKWKRYRVNRALFNVQSTRRQTDRERDECYVLAIYWSELTE